MECLLPYLCMVTVPHNIIMVGLERMLDYRGVRLERFHCILYRKHLFFLNQLSPLYVSKYTMSCEITFNRFSFCIRSILLPSLNLHTFILH